MYKGAADVCRWINADMHHAHTYHNPAEPGSSKYQSPDLRSSNHKAISNSLKSSFITKRRQDRFTKSYSFGFWGALSSWLLVYIRGTSNGFLYSVGRRCPVSHVIASIEFSSSDGCNFNC